MKFSHFNGNDSYEIKRSLISDNDDLCVITEDRSLTRNAEIFLKLNLVYSLT